MHRSGVLGAIIPEFGNLYARVLHDLYHIYTVDRHSLVAVRELEKLRAGEYKKVNPLLTEVARELDSLPLVFLALLLHDIGKGHGHDHHERGALLTAEVCRRLGLNNEEIDLVVILVREHLAMSQVAQKGDIDDETTVGEFVREVGSIDRLKALYLLTFADMRAVAPNVYNNWRDMLLSELYMRALKILEHGHREAVDPGASACSGERRSSQGTRKVKAPQDEIQKFLDEMPDRYFLTLPEGDVQLHFELMRALGEQPLVTRHRHFPDLEFSEFIVVTRDRPGLVLDDCGRADGEQSQYPFRAHHHSQGPVSRSMSSAFRIRGRPAPSRWRKIDGCWSSATSNACSPASRTSRNWWPRRITSNTRSGNSCAASPPR